MAECCKKGIAKVCNCENRIKERSPEEFSNLMHRLNRIEGQINGVKRLLEEKAYCPEIMIQVLAVNSALKSFNNALLQSHLKSCVIEDIKGGNDEAMDELIYMLGKMIK